MNTVATLQSVAPPARSHRRRLGDTIDAWLPKLVVAPSFVCCLVFVYGYILWTAVL